MSFQGDVRGIGLAELLQGLAAGRRSGRLTLTVHRGPSLVLNLLQGRLRLIAPKGEDSERWRTAAQEAWADEGDTQAAGLHMESVAFGRRLEDCYTLLDGSEVRFCFEPTEDTQGPDHPHEVEQLLLEYARVQDECQQESAQQGLGPDAIGYPLRTDPQGGAARELPVEFLAAVSGQRTLQEIADRLGWPLRRARCCMARGMRLGALGLHRGDEYLDLALACLDAGQTSRASTRLETWAHEGSPGPMPLAATRRLAGGLLSLVRPMPGSRRRTLLRRLHATHAEPALAHQQWSAIVDFDSHDPIALLHSIHPLRVSSQAVERAETCPDAAPPIASWLSLARGFQSGGTPRRALPLLTLAARHMGSSDDACLESHLELGLGLALAGRAHEASPWILGATRQLIKEERAGEAIAPLRLLLDHDGRNREARQVLAQARRAAGIRGLDLHPLLTGRPLVALVGVALLLAGSALVQVRAKRERVSQLQEMRALSSTPTLALSQLAELFAQDDGSDVQELRHVLREEERRLDAQRRAQWLQAYESIQHQATLGDPVQALEQILRLAPPPVVRRVSRRFPDVVDLRQALVQRLMANLKQGGAPQADHAQQIADESQVERQLVSIAAQLECADLSTAERQVWVSALAEPTQLLQDRQATRAQLTHEKRRVENLARQQTWMRQADALSRKGSFHKALELYGDILRIDPSGDLERALAGRMDALTLKRDRLDEARALARAGRHDQALERLGQVVDDLRLFQLPWSLRTLPAQASVTRMGKPLGTPPLQLESALDEEVQLRVSHPGYLPREIQVLRPADQLLILSRVPAQAWQRGARVDALPVEVGADRVLTDRDGHIARLDSHGKVLWERSLETLSGIARAPVFLPQRPGHLLLVSEGGRVWILDAESGTVEGPLDLGSAPVSGPAPSPDCVSVRLADGRGLGWTHGLQPRVLADVNAEDLNHDSQRFGGERGLRVYRRREDPERTHFPDADGKRTLVLQDNAYFVHWGQDPEEPADTVLLTGSWEYLAWEQSSLDAPEGRLWISDGAGLRSFVPR
jgi:tetratricopeptide (TPR) repeat protein